MKTKLYNLRIQQQSGAWGAIEYDLPLNEAKAKARTRANNGWYAAVFQGNRKVWTPPYPWEQ